MCENKCETEGSAARHLYILLEISSLVPDIHGDLLAAHHLCLFLERKGGRKGGRERRMEGGRNGAREGGRERGKGEVSREVGKREVGKKGVRERGIRK